MADAVVPKVGGDLCVYGNGNLPCGGEGSEQSPTRLVTCGVCVLTIVLPSCTGAPAESRGLGTRGLRNVLPLTETWERG